MYSYKKLLPLIPVAIALSAVAPLGAQVIHERVDESRLHRLAGNTRPEANAENDRGRVADDLPIEHILLQLTRTATQEDALQEAINDLHDSGSPSFHHWMTAAQFGATYGSSQSDRDTIAAWLESHGFTVNSVYLSGMTIDFSGTAQAVREGLHTEIHNLDVDGVTHIANMSDPEIPEALAPAVAGIVSLHDFSPRPMKKAHVAAARPDYTFTSGSSTEQTVTPGDLAVIYDLNPLFAAGITGTNQTIAVIEDTDLYKASDWTTFRSTFGLSQYTAGSLATVHPAPATGRTNCADPGIVAGDDGEAILDAEWASAAAPNAAIEVASCANTRATFGGLIALENLIGAKTPPSIVSISYGECEAENGTAANAAFSAAYQQAVAEGISVFVSAGDEGAASCDAGAKGATHGIGVSGFASTPYNVAVGGTDFGDTVAGTNSSYWSKTNSATFVSVLSYVPEIPWNDSCAGVLLSGFFGFSQSYGTTGFCGSSSAQKDDLLEVAAGSGGPSGCATGTPMATGIVGGTCAGYKKPSWQTGVAGIPADGVRDMPDVSLFAADGIWGHFYIYCWSDVRNGGASCAGAPSTWAGAGGTSFASPILAGIQALVNQKNGGAQGNPNYVYYKLAATAANVCNSSGAVTGGCIFRNGTKGDMAVNCGGTQSCFGATPQTTTTGRRGGFGSSPSAPVNGVLSTSDAADEPAYGAAAGWNFATGLGSLNAWNLVNNWSSGAGH